MSDQFGMPMVDCRPTHEVITELRQQVTLLREKFKEIADNFIWNGDDHSYQHWVIEVSQAALDATKE